MSSWINGQHLRAIPKDQVEKLVGETLKGGEQPILPPTVNMEEAAVKVLIILLTLIELSYYRTRMLRINDF